MLSERLVSLVTVSINSCTEVEVGLVLFSDAMIFSSDDPKYTKKGLGYRLLINF